MDNKGQKNKKHTKIKLDFNLLQSGTWVLERKGRQRIHFFEKEVGDGKIVIYNALDVPNLFDSKVLDYLMLKSQENDWSHEIIIPTISTIIKDLGLRKEKRVAERIKKALKILKNTHIEFHHCFIGTGVLEHFKQGNWELVSIGIVAKYGFEKVKNRGNPLSVKVVFDDDFISLCRHSLGYKLIPYAPIQGLRDTAYALYKWAWRWFNSQKGYGERWIGNGKKLVEWYRNELNSIAKYKYPSEVLRRVKSAIMQLNKNPEVPFYIQLKEENGRYKIEIYRKDQHSLKRDIPFDRLPKLLRNAVISLIRRKKNIKEPYALARSMSQKEIEKYLQRLVVAKVPRDAWETIVLFRNKIQNPTEREKLTPLAEESDNDFDFVKIVIERTELKRDDMAGFLDSLAPNWRDFVQSCAKYFTKYSAGSFPS